jgi:hypothetical protein
VTSRSVVQIFHVDAGRGVWQNGGLYAMGHVTPDLRIY